MHLFYKSFAQTVLKITKPKLGFKLQKNKIQSLQEKLQVTKNVQQKSRNQSIYIKLLRFFFRKLT